MLDKTTYYRQNLHAIPEIGQNLPKTKKFIIDQLKKHNCTIHVLKNNSILAFFNKKAEKTLGFRADMDALKIIEANDIKFRSKHNNQMHACGHDGHCAMLLALADNIDQKKLRYNVCLIFQSDEENEGGALLICQDPIFLKYQIDIIFGIHLWPNLDKGTIYTKKKYMMANSTMIDILIKGKNNHIALKKQKSDSLYTGCLLLNEIYKISNPNCCLNFGCFTSGEARNITSAKTIIQGSLRTLDQKSLEKICSKLILIKTKIQKQTNCQIEIDFIKGYPAVINDSFLINKIKKKVDLKKLELPVFMCDDFSYYQKYTKAIYFFLGTGENLLLHTSTFNFDDKILSKGLEFYLNLLEINL